MTSDKPAISAKIRRNQSAGRGYKPTLQSAGPDLRPARVVMNLQVWTAPLQQLTLMKYRTADKSRRVWAAVQQTHLAAALRREAEHEDESETSDR